MADMISVATGFQSSVNIAYDINDEAKLKNYIPTKSALKLLEDILLSTGKESTDRARILIGAYGKGKDLNSMWFFIWICINILFLMN